MLYWPNLLTTAYAISKGVEPYVALYLWDDRGLNVFSICMLTALSLASGFMASAVWIWLVDRFPSTSSHTRVMLGLAVVGVWPLAALFVLPETTDGGYQVMIVAGLLLGNAILHQPLAALIDSAIVKVLGDYKIWLYGEQILDGKYFKDLTEPRFRHATTVGQGRAGIDGVVDWMCRELCADGYAGCAVIGSGGWHGGCVPDAGSDPDVPTRRTSCAGRGGAAGGGGTRRRRSRVLLLWRTSGTEILKERTVFPARQLSSDELQTVQSVWRAAFTHFRGGCEYAPTHGEHKHHGAVLFGATE